MSQPPRVPRAAVTIPRAARRLIAWCLRRRPGRPRPSSAIPPPKEGTARSPSARTALSLAAMVVGAALAVACSAASGSDGQPDRSAPGGGEVLSATEIAGLVSGADGETFTITYRIESTTVSGGAARAVRGTWTWAQDPASGRARFETDAVEGVEGALVVVTDPEGTVFCAHERCLRVPPGPGPFFNPATSLRDQLDELRGRLSHASVWDAGTRTVAGIDGRCVAFEEQQADVAGTACFGAMGLPVHTEWHGPGGRFLLEATAFEPRVNGGLDPPYPVAVWGQ